MATVDSSAVRAAMTSQDPPEPPKRKDFQVISCRDPTKKISILQFVSEKNLLKTDHVTMARENNLKEYKSAYNIDSLPTSGAGSVFGREAKEEARRKKFGYVRKKYNPEAQPWLMQVSSEDTEKKYKGTRNGGILENTSYFIFSKINQNTFEALPVEEWYNFKPTITYSNLNAEEAEEEFAKRDKNLNMFNIMVRKRLKKEGEEEDNKEAVKSEIKAKGLMLTEMEDWGDMSDEEGRDAVDSDDSINGKKVKGKGKGKKKKKEKDTDDEAVEDSDDGDKEAKQVDYMSDTSDSDSDMEGRADKSKYEEKGVEDEDGLREIAVESDDEDKDKPEEEKKDKPKESDASSSSSEGESDDPDDDEKGSDFAKAFLMTGTKKDRGKSPVPRPSTPTEDRKRRLQGSPRSDSPSSKKVKLEPTTAPSASKASEDRPSTPVASGQGSRDGLTEESVRRYLLRKPMSSKDLVKLFKTKKLGLTIEEIVTKISAILKKLNTKQQKINGVMHFSMGD